MRLIDNLGGEHIQIETTEVIETKEAIYLRFRVSGKIPVKLVADSLGSCWDGDESMTQSQEFGIIAEPTLMAVWKS